MKQEIYGQAWDRIGKAAGRDSNVKGKKFKTMQESDMHVVPGSRCSAKGGLARRKASQPMP